MSEVDLQPLIEQKLIEITSLSPDERSAFIQLAHLVDDGEARRLTIAENRDWTVGTDDKKALKICRKQIDCRAVTMPEFMRIWAKRTDPEPQVIEEALRKIYVRSVYLPGSSHPEYDWWNRHSRS